MSQLELFFDVVSPYSYMACARVDAVAAEHGVTVRWRPFFLGGVMKATGNRPPAELPARGLYMLTDLQRWSARLGVPFGFPSIFPMNTLVAQRILASEPDHDAMRDLALRLFRAYWAEDRDISDPAVLADIAGAAALVRAATPDAKAALRDASDEAVSRGAFGAPTFYLGEQMWFGNDRLDWAVEAAARG